MAVTLRSSNINNQTEFWQQLMQLRALTARTGMLYEPQVLQLKLWPRLIFQTSTASVFKVDAPKKKIVFEITNSGKAFKPRRGERTIAPSVAPGMLDEWARGLLGPDWDITICVKAKPDAEAKKHRFGPKKVAKETVDQLCARLAKQDAEAKK